MKAVASGGVDEGGGSAVRLRGDESGDINFVLLSEPSCSLLLYT